MIGYLTGKIISKKPTELLLDVNGVGYLINITIPTFEKLGEEHENVSLYTYLNVKEDSLSLYGFNTISEKEMFQLLIGISGIGPKLAQSILSGIQIDDLREALVMGNLGRITAIPGIGKKTGERLLVELKDKVDKISSEPGEPESSFSIRNDAVMALTNLGYSRKIADDTIRNILSANPECSIEELIKNALTLLNK